MMAAPSPGRAMLLMARLRLTRLLNQADALLFRAARRKRAGRAATPGKRRNSWLLALLIALMAGFSFTQLARNAVLNLHCHIDAACAATDDQGATYMALEKGAAALATTPFSPHLASALTMMLTLLLLVSVLFAVGSRELAQADWDLEWLATLPVRRKTLLWGRVLERSVSNPTALFALLPLCGLLAWYSGLRWSVPLAMLAMAALLLPLTALCHTLADTGLRMWLPASQLRNLQALTSLASMPILYFVMALGMPNGASFPIEWAAAYPAWSAWTPPGVMIQLLQAATPGRAAALAALLLAQVGLLLAGGVALLGYQLRHGVVASGERASGRPRVRTTMDEPTKAGADHATATPRAGARGLLSPVKRRELRLLSRDRNFLVQSLLLPVVIIGSQLMFNGALHDLGQFAHHPSVVAAVAFGIGSYVLMLSAFQTLNNEGPVLWLLYTFPRNVESVLREKVQLWGVLALFYPLGVFGLALHAGAPLDWPLAGSFLLVLTGMPVFAVIAVALGVFACDPLATDVRTRVRPSYVYLYMLLASFYGYSIYTTFWPQKLVVMVLCGALALAMWQKARDELPYLLDPAAAPPARVSTADGLMAATAFFVLQALIGMLLSDGPGKIGLQGLTIAFASAGATVYGCTRLIYWRNRTAGVPAIVRGGDAGTGTGTGAGAAAGLGLAMAVPAIAVGLAYLAALRHSALAPALSAAATGATLHPGWMLALAVLAAPLCEEFIFRGLIFGGLRRSMGALPAMLVSAAVFAIVHPPLSMLPVFVLGLLTAWSYERSKRLLAPMLVHALYNAAVVSWQLWY
ncbi:CPBP family intramembrane metalloprotease [Duganella sp. LX20W]|uniref:CPBP family intramembrane metalloprotease n=1 Tax=Rugamonas brunnea TaxID=2758569 RepID=A0A7W2EPN9_9BURK|nr:CPBP family intramembrane glutamic endopeptidase [Rugamonas brunnea]MBA5636347.1 CPBP family intramembrane metalloprotease [Rugamonas brunnea]